MFEMDCNTSAYTQDEIIHHRVEFDSSLPAKYVMVDITSDEEHHSHRSLKITKIVLHPISCGTRKA